MSSENEFGKRLEDLMNQRGYSNIQITKELELSKNAIGNYKNNQIPNASILYKLSQILGTTMEYLLTGKEAEGLSEEEQELLKAYRKASPGIQEATKKLLDVKAGSRLGELSTSKIG